MTEQIAEWMRENGVKRLVHLPGSPDGWAVYLEHSEVMGTGWDIDTALADARRFA